MLLKNIKKVEMKEKEDAFSDDIYKITGNDNAKFDSLLIYLPASSSKGMDFLNTLKK